MLTCQAQIIPLIPDSQKDFEKQKGYIPQYLSFTVLVEHVNWHKLAKEYQKYDSKPTDLMRLNDPVQAVRLINLGDC